MSKKNKKSVQQLKNELREKLQAITDKPKPAPLIIPQIPSFSISLNGDNLIATDCVNHSVVIPLDLNGLRVLKQMLLAKQLKPVGSLGSVSQPTQQMVDEFLRNKELEKENEQLAILKEF